MQKDALIAKMAEQSGLSKRDAERALNAFIASIKDAMVNGEKVQLVNFGSFEVRERNARKGRNPQTGAVIDIPATKVPVFNAGAGLKKAVAK